MRRTAFSALTILAMGAVVLLGQGRGNGNVIKEFRSLSAEYELAKQPKAYFVLDVARKRMELRIQGLAMKTWEIPKVRFWGRPDFSKAVEVTRKSALKAPQRVVIKPGEPDKKTPDTGKFELEALELQDMPTSFSFYFDNGLHLSIKTVRKGFGGFGRHLREALDWYISLPLRNLFSTRRGHPLSELEFTFENERDAQTMYWVFYEGMKGLLQ